MFPSAAPRSLRPARTFGSPGVESLVSNSPFTTRTYVTLWSLTGAGTATPELDGREHPGDGLDGAASGGPEGGDRGHRGVPGPLPAPHGKRSDHVGRVAKRFALVQPHRRGRLRPLQPRALRPPRPGGARCPWRTRRSGPTAAGISIPRSPSTPETTSSWSSGEAAADEYAGIRFTARSTADASLRAERSAEGRARGATSCRSGSGSRRIAGGTSSARRSIPRIRAGSGWSASTPPHGTDGAPGSGRRRSRGGAAAQASPSALCLGNGRFRATASWRKADGTSGQGTAVSDHRRHRLLLVLQPREHRGRGEGPERLLRQRPLLGVRGRPDQRRGDALGDGHRDGRDPDLPEPSRHGLPAPPGHVGVSACGTP